MTIIERLEELENVTDYVDALWQKFDSEYEVEIDELFREYADDNVDFFYHDLDNFLTNNIELVEDDINNFGWCGDLYGHVKSAEFSLFYDEICKYDNEVIEYCILEYINHKKSNIANETEIVDMVGNLVENLDLCNTTKEVMEVIEKVWTSLE